jgi:hypothetical protein
VRKQKKSAAQVESNSEPSMVLTTPRSSVVSNLVLNSKIGEFTTLNSSLPPYYLNIINVSIFFWSKTHQGYTITGNGTGKDNAFPLQAWTSPYDSKRLRLPEFLDSRDMKVERLSALITGRLYPAGDKPGTHLCWRLSRLQGQSAAGKMKSMNSSGIEPTTLRLVAQRKL